MKRRDFNAYMGAAGAVAMTAANAKAGEASKWQFRADVAESCSCEIPCPCNFGRRTKLKCEGSRLIQITEGNIGGADLAGVGFVVTFDMGNWTRMYMDDAMTAAQREAWDKIFPAAFGGFKKLMTTLEYVPLSVERSADKVRFSAPASTVEIEMMKGLDGGPIVVNNLPSAAYHNYVQYESLVHQHKSEAAEFSHKGTNGFTSTMIAAG